MKSTSTGELTPPKQRRIFCNVVDAPKQASFIMPSIIDRSPLMMAVSSGGRAPVLARLLREKLEAMLPQHLGQLAALAGSLRERVKQHFSRPWRERRRFWERLFANDRLAQSLANDDRDTKPLGRPNARSMQLFSEPLDHRGEVVLVGAGPGDAGLLTLKGLQQIQQADVVVYDRLVSDDDYESGAPRRRTRLRRQTRGPPLRAAGANQPDPAAARRSKANAWCALRAAIPLSLAAAAKSWRPCAGGRQRAVLGGAGHHRRLRLFRLQRYSAHPPRPCPERAPGDRPPARPHGELDWRNAGRRAADAGVLYGAQPGGHDSAAAVTARDGRSDAGGAGGKRHLAATQRVACATLQELATLAQQVASPALIIVGRVVSLRTQLNWF